jgi:hypothetical protein
MSIAGTLTLSIVNLPCSMRLRSSSFTRRVSHEVVATQVMPPVTVG